MSKYRNCYASFGGPFKVQKNLSTKVFTVDFQVHFITF